MQFAVAKALETAGSSTDRLVSLVKNDNPKLRPQASTVLCRCSLLPMTKTRHVSASISPLGFPQPRKYH